MRAATRFVAGVTLVVFGLLPGIATAAPGASAAVVGRKDVGPDVTNGPSPAVMQRKDVGPDIGNGPAVMQRKDLGPVIIVDPHGAVATRKDVGPDVSNGPSPVVMQRKQVRPAATKQASRVDTKAQAVPRLNALPVSKAALDLNQGL